MDHRYIEQHALADRYLDHALPPPERAAFEAHLVDCQECTDRVLLAEMFHNRNGKSAAKATLPQPELAQPQPQPQRRTRVAIHPRIFWLLAAAALLLLLVPCGFFLWELHSLRP
ncbi:MAG TPA: zf-HC2 domain-containing protein [Bryobacteraceae bacterium]